MLGIGIRFALRGRRGGFSPASLFKAGEKGYALDFTDKSKLFQNSNGTTAVASTNDPIGYATDLSGNGNHALQATAGSRPLWAATGAVADGTKEMTVAGIDFSTTDKCTVIASVSFPGGGNHGIVNHGGFGTGDFYFAMTAANGNILTTSLVGSSGTAANVNTHGTVAAGFHVASTVIDLAEALGVNEAKVRVNGEVYGNTNVAAGPAGSGNLASRDDKLFSFFGILGTLTINRIIVIGRLLTVDELYAAEYWAGVGAGLYLITELPPAGQSAYQILDTYGQSLSVGAPNDAPVSTTTRYSGDTMFVTHLKTSVAGFSFASLVDLVETTDTLSGSPLGETPVAGWSEYLHEQSGFSGSALGMATGFPAITIAQCQSGQSQYTARLAAITAAWRRGREAFKHTKQLAFAWLQGESDGANNTYAANLNTLRNSINTDVKAITGQTEDIWCLSYQLDRAKIGLAHLEAQETYSKIVVAAPIYFLRGAYRNADLIHFTSLGSKIMGAYFGLAYQNVIVNGNTSWKPLMCTNSSTVGAVCTLTFNPVGALAFDTTLVTAQTNQGFKLYESDGTTPVTISSVAISGSTVVITASGSIPAGAILRYGFSDPTDHTAGTAMGNLRDSQGDTIVFDGGGIDFPMHNWCVLFQRTIN